MPIYLLPVVASTVLLAVGWDDRRHPLLCIGWIAVCGALQLLSGPYSPAWAAGLVLQVVTAAYLAIRFKVD